MSEDLIHTYESAWDVISKARYAGASTTQIVEALADAGLLVPDRAVHDQRFPVSTTVRMHGDRNGLTAEVTWRQDMNDDPVMLVHYASDGLATLMRDQLIQPSLDAKALRELREHVRFARESLDLLLHGDENAVTRALRDLENAVFEDAGDNVPAVLALADSWFGSLASEASAEDLRAGDNNPGGGS